MDREHPIDVDAAANSIPEQQPARSEDRPRFTLRIPKSVLEYRKAGLNFDYDLVTPEAVARETAHLHEEIQRLKKELGRSQSVEKALKKELDLAHEQNSHLSLKLIQVDAFAKANANEVTNLQHKLDARTKELHHARQHTILSSNRLPDSHAEASVPLPQAEEVHSDSPNIPPPMSKSVSPVSSNSRSPPIPPTSAPAIITASSTRPIAASNSLSLAGPSHVVPGHKPKRSLDATRPLPWTSRSPPIPPVSAPAITTASSTRPIATSSSIGQPSDIVPSHKRKRSLEHTQPPSVVNPPMPSFTTPPIILPRRTQSHDAGVPSHRPVVTNWNSSFQPPPAPPIRRALGIKHLSLLYQTHNEKMACRTCKKKFPVSAPWTDLVGHAREAHKEVCEEIEALNPSQVVERAHRLSLPIVPAPGKKART